MVKRIEFTSAEGFGLPLFFLSIPWMPKGDRHSFGPDSKSSLYWETGRRRASPGKVRLANQSIYLVPLKVPLEVPFNGTFYTII